MTRKTESSNPENRARARRQILRYAERLLEESVSYIEASRRIVELSRDAWDNPHEQEEFAIFDYISSETDHLPVGRVREHWNADVLVLKDREAASRYEHYEAQLMRSSRTIIRKWREDVGRLPQS